MLFASRSLAAKIVVPIVAIMAVVIIAATWYQWVQLKSNTTERLREQTGELNGTLDAALRHSMIKADSEGAEKIVQHVARQQTVRRLYILDADGKVARASDKSGEYPTGQELEGIRRTGNSIFEARTAPDGTPYALAVTSIRSDQSCTSCHSDAKDGDALGFIGLERWTKAENEAMRAAGWTNIIVNVFMAGVIGGVLILIARAITRPLNNITDVAGRISLGDIGVTVAHESKDEIGALANSFRNMIQYIRGVAGAADAMAKGDVSIKVDPRSDKDELGKSFQRLQTTVHQLTEQTTNLVAAAKSGQLETRGEASRFQGAFRELVEGINGTMDAVSAPINESTDVLQQLAERDLSVRMEGDYRGLYGKIKEALNKAVSNLDEALAQVWMGAEQVSSAASQISSGSQSLSQGASDQAGSLEEVSSSLHEMASMTSRNAANAREASSLTHAANTAAEKGVTSMRRLSESINKIKSSSDATARIVKTIDEIAFQTNLLALNAAVEAARAGEAGKGFAVVAEEVRTLAMRSAEAAKNTAALIEESVKNAEQGVQINQEVLQNFEEINAQVRKVTEVMAEIAAASEQQSQGAQQINGAVEQINQVTQQVAANAEESASAAEELTGQASEMQGMVRRFRLTQAAHATTGATSRRTSPRRASGAVSVGTGHGKKANGGLTVDPSRLIPFDEDSAAVLREF